MANSATGGLYSRAEGDKAVSHLYGARTRAVFGITQGDASSDVGSAQVHDVILGATSPDTVGNSTNYMQGDYSEFFLDGPGGSKRLVVPPNCSWNIQGNLACNGKYPQSGSNVFNIVSIVDLSFGLIWNNGTALVIPTLNNYIIYRINNNYQRLETSMYYDLSTDTASSSPFPNSLSDTTHSRIWISLDAILGAVRIFVKETFANVATNYVLSLRITELKWAPASQSSS